MTAQYMNDAKTILFTTYDDGTAELAFRTDGHGSWGPPLPMVAGDPVPFDVKAEALLISGAQATLLGGGDRG